MGSLRFYQWVRSILHPQVFPFFSWDDPLPSIIMPFAFSVRRIRARFARAKLRRFATGVPALRSDLFSERK
jgi:hypothetical protein